MAAIDADAAPWWAHILAWVCAGAVWVVFAALGLRLLVTEVWR